MAIKLSRFYNQRVGMHEEKIIIGSNDIDTNFDSKLAVFFRTMQDVITHETNILGIGSVDLKKQNILWVISRVQVEINRLPKYQEEIICQTYPGTDMKMFYPRYFRMLDKDGNVLVNISYIWAIIDSETRKPILKCPFSEKLYEQHLSDELPFPKKIEVDEELNFIEKRKIHYSDVDLNGHLNNVRYIELMSDVHDSSFHEIHPIKSLTLNYLKEIKEGSEVEVFSSKGNPEFIQIKSDGQICFIAQITYK